MTCMDLTHFLRKKKKDLRYNAVQNEVQIVYLRAYLIVLMQSSQQQQVSPVRTRGVTEAQAGVTHVIL